MSMLELDEITAPPSWITFDGTDTITIDRTTAVPGVYDYLIKGEVLDETGTATGRYATK